MEVLKFMKMVLMFEEIMGVICVYRLEEQDGKAVILWWTSMWIELKQSWNGFELGRS